MLPPDTTINAYFCIYGDDFSVDKFTQEMEITPTTTRNQGEIFMKGTTKHVSYTTDWVYETGDQLTNNPLIQLHELVGPLNKKIDVINHYKKKFNLQSQIVIVIRFTEYQTPGLHFDHKLIKFAYETNSPYSVDIYCNVQPESV